MNITGKIPSILGGDKIMKADADKNTMLRM